MSDNLSSQEGFREGQVSTRTLHVGECSTLSAHSATLANKDTLRTPFQEGWTCATSAKILEETGQLIKDTSGLLCPEQHLETFGCISVPSACKICWCNN